LKREDDMVKKLFCLFFLLVPIHLTLSGCAARQQYVEIDLTEYKSRNMSIIERDIREKNMNMPITASDREVVLHIVQGPLGGALYDPVCNCIKGKHIMGGSEDKQMETVKTMKNAKNEPVSWLVMRDYSKSLALVMEKQLGRYFSRVRVINNDEKSAGKEINVKSLFDLEFPDSTTKKATVTITATLPAGTPITVKGTYEYHHINTMILSIAGILTMPIGIIVMTPIVVSINSRAVPSSVWLAMNIACENLASQLAPRIAEMREHIVDVELAVTGVQVR
jgi:hypothetical protein